MSVSPATYVVQMSSYASPIREGPPKPMRFQDLHDRERLLLGDRADGVAVSGGGYFGAFLGRLFERPYVRHVADVEWILKEGQGTPPVDASPELLAAARNVVAWLRENGRYLSPRGSGDLLLLFSALYRNWISIQFLLALCGVTFFLAVRLLDQPVASTGLDTRWGPLAALAVMPLVLSIPVVWSYWLAWPGWERYVPVMGAVLVGYGMLFHERLFPTAPIDLWLVRATAAIAVTACAASAWTAVMHVIRLFLDRVSDYAELRNRLASQLKNLLLVAVALGALGIVDEVARQTYGLLQGGARLAAIGSIIATFGAFARQIVVMLAAPLKGRRPGWLLSAAAYLLAVTLVVLLLVAYSLLSHAIANGFASSRVPPATIASWFAAFALLLLVFGRSVSFVNQSSHSPIYSARLARAYLGASNPDRWFASPPVATIEPVSSDDIAMADYWNPSATRNWKGAPLHLVNVTVNETVDGKSQVQQQDRKGSGMCLGPAGISVGVNHHVAFAEPAPGAPPALCILDPEEPQPGYHVFEYASSRIVFKQGATVPHARPFEGEQWRLSQWIAVSGAAFSTGMGFRTNFGLSILTGLMNVRLGQWWDSNVKVSLRTAASSKGRLGSRLFGNALHTGLPLLYYLLSEYIARFPGVARRYWYLSDGGHFENLGAYELIRRGLRTIVILDAEADPEYTLNGLANLVRKARLDFGVQIDFGESLEGLRPISLDPRTGFHRCPAHAARATVTFPGDPVPGQLIYIKASLTADEDADLVEYARAHPTFPHETTADQFFDEAQWESYRRLGEHIGSSVQF